MKNATLQERLSMASAAEKFHYVMNEFTEGRLKSSTGEKVKSKKQALVIAYSEARKHDPNYGKKSSLTKHGK